MEELRKSQRGWSYLKEGGPTGRKKSIRRKDNALPKVELRMGRGASSGRDLWLLL